METQPVGTWVVILFSKLDGILSGHCYSKWGYRGYYWILSQARYYDCYLERTYELANSISSTFKWTDNSVPWSPVCRWYLYISLRRLALFWMRISVSICRLQLSFRLVTNRTGYTVIPSKMTITSISHIQSSMKTPKRKKMKIVL